MHHLRLVLCLVACGFTGCSSSTTTKPETNSTARIARDLPERNLGWLGGTACALPETLTVTDPDDEDRQLYPGGLVLRSVVKDAPLAEMKLRKGDVLVGVGEEMLPNKEDPTMDFIRLVEGEVSAEQEQLVLRFLRNGKLREASAPIALVPLERGLPLAVERFDEISRRAVEFLLSQQQDDGSFAAASADLNATLIVSSLCGLVLQAADSTAEVATAKARCIEFVVNRLDAASQPNALAAAYALMFLVESAPPPANMEQLGKCISVIRSNQEESGAWMSSDGHEEGANAVQATFVTNQVLMALGIAERNGMMGDNEPIEKGIAYLKTQADDRIAADLDRRVKAGLAAGTAAAMVALNVDRGDKLITRLSKEAFALAADIPRSRVLSIPHALSVAILSRQSGVGAWLENHRHVKLLLTQLQLADGSFEQVPTTAGQTMEIEKACGGVNWRTAHYCLIAQMQRRSLSAFAGEKSHPMLVARGGDGKQRKDATGAASHTGTMAGALQLDLDGLDPTSMSQEELQEKLLEKLKEQGVDIDGASVQIMSTTSEPPSGKPD